MDEKEVVLTNEFVEWTNSNKFENVDHRRKKRADEEEEIIREAGGKKYFRNSLNFAAVLLCYSYDKRHPKCFGEWKLLPEGVGDSCLECICTTDNAKSATYIQNTKNGNTLLICCDCADKYENRFFSRKHLQKEKKKQPYDYILDSYQQLVDNAPKVVGVLILGVCVYLFTTRKM